MIRDQNDGIHADRDAKKSRLRRGHNIAIPARVLAECLDAAK
jgi:hypothetical protein